MKAFEFTPSELERIQTSLLTEKSRLEKVLVKAKKDRNYRLVDTLTESLEECIILVSKITIEVDKNSAERLLSRLKNGH